jgi:phospholipid/cholesterol/gamma-HCH transport system substrate-binding protein
MQRLGSFADEATPVFADLGAQAPAINRFIAQLGPFAQAGIPAFESLGDAAEVGTPAMIAARPIVRDLRTFAKQVRPLASTAGALLDSLRETRGFERALDYAFYQVAAVNGFDSFGHYLRAGLIVNQCSTYAVDPTPGCTANFAPATATAAAASGPQGPRDQTLIATAEAIRRAMAGQSGEKAPRLQPTPTPSPERTGDRERRRGKSGPAATATPAPSATAAPQATASPQPGEPAAPAPAPAATPEPTTGGDDPLLDFLFGKDQP